VTASRSPQKALAASEPANAAVLRYPGPAKLFIIWTIVGVLSSLRVQFQRPPNAYVGQLAFMLAFSGSYYPWIALSPWVFRLEKRFPLGGGDWRRNLAILTLFSFGICLLASPLMVAMFHAGLSVVGPSRTLSGRPFAFWLAHFPFAEVVFWCSVTGGYFIRTLNQLREQEQRAASLVLEKSRLEASLKQAQLDVLRARLNPHFLFNSLQNISALTRPDPQTASRMLCRLGDLLRAVLRRDSEPEHSLEDEIELTRDYVALEQMRFGDRLEVTFDLAPDTRAAMAPCFFLQPLIENAIIHGLRGMRKNGAIVVTARREGGELVVRVLDNGAGPPEEDPAKLKVGVGVGSTRERLATMYPDRHSFALRRRPEGGAEVRIAIPLHFPDGKEGVSGDERAAAADRRR
jgi:sensor histidine kinase YesM